MSSETISDIPLDQIDPFVGQSREHFPEADLRQLARDIKERGLLQPGVAWYDPGRSRYILIAGERRYRALKLEDFPTMAVKVIAGELTQGKMLEINISENLQRENLSAVERARAFRRLMQLEGINARQVSERLHISDATVSRDLSLLELPATMQAEIIAGTLPASVGATLARLPSDQERRELADQYGGGHITRDGVAAEVKRRLKPGKPTAGKGVRLAGTHEGIAFSISSDKPFGRDRFMSLIDHIRQKAARKIIDGIEAAEPAGSLRTA